MNRATNQTIHRQMTIKEVLALFPQKAHRLSQEITNAGLHCMGCSAATWETLEVGMYGHGKSEEEIDRLVERLNLLLDEEEMKSDADAITLTAKAAKKYLSILEEEGKQGWGLRFEEKAAGCNGFEYSLDYSQAATEEDQVFLSQGIEIHVNNRMVKRLIGSLIDYVEGIHSGFKISNPNVRSSCGCGTSHGY